LVTPWVNRIENVLVAAGFEIRLNDELYALLKETSPSLQKKRNSYLQLKTHTVRHAVDNQ
jgi:hypothetical protein